MLPLWCCALTIGVTYLSIGSPAEAEVMPDNLMTGPKGGNILKQRADPNNDPFGNSNPAKKMQHQMKRISRQHVALNQRMSKAEQDRSEAIAACDKATRECVIAEKALSDMGLETTVEITILKGKAAELQVANEELLNMSTRFSQQESELTACKNDLENIETALAEVEGDVLDYHTKLKCSEEETNKAYKEIKQLKAQLKEAKKAPKKTKSTKE